MSKLNTTCFICKHIHVPPVDPKLIPGGQGQDQRRLNKNLSILLQLQRALELPALRTDQSDIVNQISFCKSCLDEVEGIKNVLDAFDNLKKVVERQRREILFKFLKSKGQECRGISRKSLELNGMTELRSQMVADLRSQSTTTTESSKTPVIFKRVTRTRTKPNNFRRQATSQRTSPLGSPAGLQISRSSLPSQEILTTHQLEISEDGVFSKSNDNGSKATSRNNLYSEQRQSGATVKAGPSGIKKAKASSDPSNTIQQISSGKTKPPKSPSISTLRNKPQIEARSNEKKHKCQSCPTRFKTKSDLTRHLRTHTGEKPFSCRLCPKTFSNKSYLKEHQVVHSGEKRFRCRFCSKTFARPKELKAHERVHTGERPFLCKICSKTFSLSGTLVSHMRTHTREKPYPCKMCSKTFSQPGTLVTHMRTHTREKPYPCKMCTKTFSRCDTLVRHMRTHTREKPYKCTACSREFAQLGTLKDHKKTQHLLKD